MKRTHPLFLLTLLLFPLSLFGQVSTFIEDGQWHQINYTGSYQDFKLGLPQPFGYSGIEFRIVGADGGIAAVNYQGKNNTFQTEAGRGAETRIIARVNQYYNHPEYFSSVQTFRFIVGGKGMNGDVIKGAGGGGGSAILVYNGLPSENTTTVVAASGGGGGAGGDYDSSVSENKGMPASIGTSGTWGRRIELGSDPMDPNKYSFPGSNGEGAHNPLVRRDNINVLGGGGGGAFSAGEPFIYRGKNCTIYSDCEIPSGGGKGMTDGGAGGYFEDDKVGGYGFGGGGAGVGWGGGGGGGYSGGAYGRSYNQGGGGGGGSFIADRGELIAGFSSQSSNGTTLSPSNGYIEYRFIHVKPQALCKNVTIDLEVDGQATLTPASVDAGSYSDHENISLSLSKSSFNCQDASSQTVTLIVTGEDSGISSSCESTVTIRPAALNCIPKVTLVLDNDGYTREITTDDLLESIAFNHCGDFINFDISPRTQWRCWGLGDNTVTLTATNAYGNKVSCTSTITIIDNMAPTAVCKNTTVQLDQNGEATITAATVNGGSYDNCYTPGNGFSLAISGPTSFNCSDVGSHTVTLTITDHVGLQDQCTATVNIADPLAPELQCPSNKSYEINTDNCAYLPTLDEKYNYEMELARIRTTGQGLGYVLDNCPNSIVISNSLSNDNLSNTEIPLGENIITYTVKDASNNTRSCSFTVKVIDNEGPQVQSCPPSAITVDAEEGACEAVVHYDLPVFIDNCDGQVDPLRFGGFNSGENFPVGSTTFSFYAIDSEGNRSQYFDGQKFVTLFCETTVTVRDVTPPVAMCKESITIAFPNDGTYPSRGIQPSDIFDGIFDACSGIKEVYVTGEKYIDCNSPRENIVTLTLVDNDGNTSSCQTTVIFDDVPPAAKCKDISVALDWEGNATIRPNDIALLLDFSPCHIYNGPELNIDRNSFTCSDVGPQVVTLTMTDYKKRTTTCQSTVTVVDNKPPSVIPYCNSQQTVELDANGQASLALEDVVTGAVDACGIESITMSKSDFGCSDVGQTTTLVTATDVNGNNGTCLVGVTVKDLIAPTAVCKNFTVELGEDGTATLTGEDIDDGSTDACGISSRLVSGKTSFDCSDVDNTYSVMLIVTDNNGNENTCNAEVTVADVTPPSSDCKDITVQLDEKGEFILFNALFEEDGDVTNNDNCSIGGGAIIPNKVTCENAGQTLEVTVILGDVHGNSTTCEAYVTVEDNLAPTAICQDVTIQLDTDGNASITTADIDNGSSDVCGIASLALDKTSFGCSNLGNNTVKLTVIDNNGNESTCNATVIVEDLIAPKVTCQDLTVHLVDGQASIPTSAIVLKKSDNCGFKTVATEMLYFDCSDAGTTIDLSYTVFDKSENKASCNNTVTIVDQQVPAISCPDPIEVDIQAGQCESARILYDLPEANDACGVTSLERTAGLESGSIFPLGETTVTYQVKDLSGNSAECSFTVMLTSTQGDSDGDGIINDCDNCPTTPNFEQTDEDQDGVGDECEACPGGDDTIDTDGDEIPDACDNCPDKKNEDQADSDGNGIGDACEKGGGKGKNIIQTLNNQFSLEPIRVFPNPFNQQLNIEFIPTQEGPLTIDVFNLQGQRVHNLYNGWVNAGEYLIQQWDGTDIRGAQLPSGVYLIQLRSGKEVLNKKVLLQKQP